MNFAYIASNCLVIRLHQLVRFDHFGKAFDLGCMAPRLQLDLLPHHSRKAPGPAVSWILLYHALDRVLMHQLWILARIVEDRRKVRHSTNRTDASGLSEILVADDGLSHSLVLGLRRVVLLEKIMSKHAAVELKGHLRGILVVLGGADVVEQTSEKVCLGAVAPLREVLLGYCLTC